MVDYIFTRFLKISNLNDFWKAAVSRNFLISIYRMAFEASVANNQRYEDVNVTFPIEVSDPNVRQDVHSVSSLLKLYFRELPDPLCTYKLYEEFLEAARAPEDLRLSAMRQVVKALSKEHFR